MYNRYKVTMVQMWEFYVNAEDEETAKKVAVGDKKAKGIIYERKFVHDHAEKVESMDD